MKETAKKQDQHANNTLLFKTLVASLPGTAFVQSQSYHWNLRNMDFHKPRCHGCHSPQEPNEHQLHMGQKCQERRTEIEFS